MVQPRLKGQNGQMHFIPSGLSTDDATRRLIQENPALQIILSKSDQMPDYLAIIPVTSREPEIQGQQIDQLSLLFRHITLSERFDGFPVFEAYQLTPRAQEIWHCLFASRALDPLFLHFSGRDAELYQDKPFSVATYELYSTSDGNVPEDFRQQPWVKSILSDDVLGDALPAIEVPGWTLDELITDPIVRLLAGCVAHLYYCEFTGTPRFPKQLRYVLHS